MSDLLAAIETDDALRRTRFEAIWAEHHARVLAYVLRRTASGEDAADAVADTFLIAWRRLGSAPAENTHLWLYAVARRVLANQRRGAQRRVRLADRLRAEWAEHDPVRREPEDAPRLARAFAGLPEADREVLALQAWEQLDTAGIAAVLGCSRNAVRIRLHRARRRLRTALEDESAEPRHRPLARRPTDPAVLNGDVA